jgi:glyoxylase I family protein
MSEAEIVTDASPVSGFSHAQLLVSDVAASEAWYLAVLGLERLTAADDGSYLAMRHRPSGVVLVLSAASDVPEGGRLDHLAFAAADKASLEAWAEHLSALGFENSGVNEEGRNWSLQLRDPDGISIELVAGGRATQ